MGHGMKLFLVSVSGASYQPPLIPIQKSFSTQTTAASTLEKNTLVQINFTVIITTIGTINKLGTTLLQQYVMQIACVTYTFNIAAGINNIGFLETQFSNSCYFYVCLFFTCWGNVVWSLVKFRKIFFKSCPQKAVPFLDRQIYPYPLFVYDSVINLQCTTSTKVGFSGCDLFLFFYRPYGKYYSHRQAKNVPVHCQTIL